MKVSGLENRIFLAVVMVGFICLLPGHVFSKGFPAPNTGCISINCHAGIEPIRDHNSGMAKQIYDMGKKYGDPNGCVVCHGGNPNETQNKDIAHSGAPEGCALNTFVTYPGSPWVNDKTCGLCHKAHVYAEQLSLMQTEAGKIQGALWGWDIITGYMDKSGKSFPTKYGNYTVKDTDGLTPVFGTPTYKKYMVQLAKQFPYMFPGMLERLPRTDVSKIQEQPNQAIYTYLRSDCERCHVGVKGRLKRGDMRGIGCAACHVPYSVEGYYEGGDEKGIPRDKKNHVLVHSIIGTRKAKATVNGKTFSGIPDEMCASCHNRGKRIGVSFQGIMEFPYGMPFTSKGMKQPKLHTKKYIYIREDVHHRIKSREGNPNGRLLCQDCHTTVAMHGNGNISGTTLADVEIECTDCHGTATSYPWELPIGYGDEFGRKLDAKPRGVAKKLLPVQEKFSTVYPPEDGYILTSRGNPMGNVVRKGSKVIVHSATGLDFEVPTIKSLVKADKWKDRKWAVTAMVKVKKHREKLECYTCHSTWAPQCYGCHVKVDYSKGKTSTDWVRAGNMHTPDGNTAESRRYGDVSIPKQPGKSYEGRSFLRWEYPVLGVNGEGRVTPLIPGCQQITTVIGPDGKLIIHNKIWHTPGGLENSGPEGQRGIDMAPATPHTVTPKARKCATCHTSPKAMGYGVGDGEYMLTHTKDKYFGLMNAQGELLSKKVKPQIPGIPDLPMSLDRIVTRDGKQLQTVGHHWPLSRALDNSERNHMERAGICISCHETVPGGALTFKILHTVGKSLGAIPVTDKDHQKLLLRIMYTAAFIEVWGIPIAVIVLFVLITVIRRRRSAR